MAKFSINLWHKRAAIKAGQATVPRIVCKDGFDMSVQASGFHYCTPRQDKAWPYKTFEIGFPSRKEQLIKEYAETPGAWTETVYAQVPASVVNAIVAKHGGLK